METEKIISAIKEKIGTTDFSDRTIGVYVSQNPIEDGAEPDESYFEKGSNFFKALQGQYNHDFSQKLNSKVDELKQSYEPKPQVEPTPKPDVNDSDKRYNELLNKLSEVESKLNEKELKESQQKYNEELSKAFKSKLEERGITYDPIYYKSIILESGNLDTSVDLDDMVEKVIPKYEKLLSENNRSGATPTSSPKVIAQESNKRIDDFFAQKKAQRGIV